jgi:hypothetical protein
LNAPLHAGLSVILGGTTNSMHEGKNPRELFLFVDIDTGDDVRMFVSNAGIGGHNMRGVSSRSAPIVKSVFRHCNSHILCYNT